MKKARLNRPHNSFGLKGLMRVLRVAGGFRPLVIEQPTKMVRGREYKLHPTKGWRLA